MEKKTALTQLIELYNEPGRIKDRINYKTVQRALYSYNDRMTKRGTPEKKVNAKELIDKLKENPNKKTLKTVITQINRKQGKGQYKPRTTTKLKRKSTPKGSVSFVEPPVVIQPKKRTLTEAERAKLYHFHAEERRKSAIAKKAAVTLSRNRGLGVARSEEIGRLFAKVKLNDGSYIKDYMSSDMVIETANQYNDFNERELYDLLLGKAKLNNNDIKREVNDLLGIELYEIEEEDEEGAEDGDVLFGGGLTL